MITFNNSFSSINDLNYQTWTQFGPVDYIVNNVENIDILSLSLQLFLLSPFNDGVYCSPIYKWHIFDSLFVIAAAATDNDIYIYIYRERERETERQTEAETDRQT